MGDNVVDFKASKSRESEADAEPSGVKFDCKKCGRPITEPGALAFSPPSALADTVTKYHICQNCWIWLLRWLRTGADMDFTEWLELGERLDYVAGRFCAVHDGLPMDEDEIEQLEEGFDSCIAAIRVKPS